MREQLIGYLLKAVEPEEHRQVEEQLQQDESLRRDMTVLKRSLHPLAADQNHHQPPPNLAERCCQYVYSRTEIMPVALSPAGTIGGVVNKRRWSWLDLSVAGAIAVAVAVLLLPAIYQSTVHARLLACQNNLKDIGYATASYSDHHNGYYPAPEQGDPIGEWAPMLATEGFLPQADRSMVCPASDLRSVRGFHVPRTNELKAMTVAQRAAVADRLSGSYGETLGYTDDHGYQARRKADRTRKTFAVASDLPGERGGEQRQPRRPRSERVV